jgi:hypothetical protein
MLFEHRPSHLNKSSILTFKNTILLRYICRGKLMLKSHRITKGLKMSVLEFCAIVTVIHSHGILGKLILQLKNEISSMRKRVVLRLHENTQE